MSDSISVLHFSPTGNTRKIALIAAECFGREIKEYDLTDQNVDIPAFTASQVVVVSMPDSWAESQSQQSRF